MTEAETNSILNLELRSSLLPLGGAVSADIEYAYIFCVECFNKKAGLGLGLFVKEWCVFKVRSKNDSNTLNSEFWLTWFKMVTLSMKSNWV